MDDMGAGLDPEHEGGRASTLGSLRKTSYKTLHGCLHGAASVFVEGVFGSKVLDDFADLV